MMHAAKGYGLRASGCSLWSVARSLSCSTIVLLASCTLPQRSFQPAQDPAALDDVSFLHYLATVPVVTVDEGMRAVLLLVRDSNLAPATSQWPTFDRRREALRRLGAVKAAWRLKPGRILDKGTLAYMLRTVCNVPRSLNEVLASVTGLGERRYALKTCIREGLLSQSLSHEPVIGGEILSALTNAERYLASKSADNP